MPLEILVAEPFGFSPGASTLLHELGNVVFADLDRPGLLSAVKRTDVLWVRLRHQIDAAVLGAAPRLKAIVTPTTGLDHVDIETARARGISVVSLLGETEFLRDVRATAELTVGLILALLRNLPSAAAHVLEGGWSRDLFKGRELFGRTAGVVGYGRVGRIVARYLQSLDMCVLACDRNSEATTANGGVTVATLEELLSRADIVTLHVNSSPETRGFFGRRQFERMKDRALFINTARGELVDEDALLEALQSGRLGGAALDVLGNERLVSIKNHPLVVYGQEKRNLIITPHIGGCTEESMEKTEVFLAKKLRAALKATVSTD
jgi:D-3-phosphoglycerate dehydrogenase